MFSKDMVKKTVKVIKLNDALINSYKTKKAVQKEILNTPPEKIKDILREKYKTKLTPSEKKVRFNVPKKTYRSPKISKKKYSHIEKNINFIETNSVSNSSLIDTFSKVKKKNNLNITSSFIQKINRKQLNIVLLFVNMIKRPSKAPTPLLKNLLYNYLTSSIKIII